MSSLCCIHLASSTRRWKYVSYPTYTKQTKNSLNVSFVDALLKCEICLFLFIFQWGHSFRLEWLEFEMVTCVITSQRNLSKCMIIEHNFRLTFIAFINELGVVIHLVSPRKFISVCIHMRININVKHSQSARIFVILSVSVRLLVNYRTQ